MVKVDVKVHKIKNADCSIFTLVIFRIITNAQERAIAGFFWCDDVIMRKCAFLHDRKCE